MSSFLFFGVSGYTFQAVSSWVIPQIAESYGALTSIKTRKVICEIAGGMLGMQFGVLV